MGGIFMKLKLFKEDYAVCNLDKNISSPICIDTNSFYYITKIKEQLSLICLDQNIPKEVKLETDLKLIEILKPLNLYLVGMVSKMNKVLTDAKINIFTISTNENDYILVKNKDIENACRALKCNGFEIV
jgi:hypothetical protein